MKKNKTMFLVFILMLLGQIPLVSCSNKDYLNDDYIHLKTDTFSLDEPLLMSCKGEGQNWVGLFGDEDDYPIYWAYLEEVPNEIEFDLKTKNKGFRHNGYEDLHEGTFSLKWFLEDDDSIDEAKTSIDINFVNAPLVEPLEFDYCLNDINSGYSAGKITVKSEPNLVNNASITMFWANEDGILEDYNSLARFEITSEVTEYTVPNHILIPNEATKLYVYSSRHYNLSKKHLEFKLPDTWKKKDLGNIKYTYTVCSDTQLPNDINSLDYKHLEEMFKDIESQDYDNQAILINGDVAEHGEEIEYQNLMTIYNKHQNLPKMYMSIGNHELQYGVNEEDLIKYQNIFLKYATLPDGSHPTSLNYDFYHNDYHFIMVGNNKMYHSSDINLNDDSLNWFKTTLSKDYDPKKPTFIFMHQPLHNTVAGSLASQGWNGVMSETETKLREILKDYPKAILFTGHTHWNLNSYQNIYADDPNMPRCVNTAAVAYEWKTYGNTYGAGRYHSGSEGYIMDIYEDKVILRGRDYLTHKWVPSAYYCFEY